MNKMYVIVRNDLSLSQKAVQAGHALAEYLINISTDWKNGTLVYLKVPDKSALQSLHERLKFQGYDHAHFVEPDLNHEITALACLGNNKFFKRLELL